MNLQDGATKVDLIKDDSRKVFLNQQDRWDQEMFTRQRKLHLSSLDISRATVARPEERGDPRRVRLNRTTWTVRTALVFPSIFCGSLFCGSAVYALGEWTADR